MAISYSRPSALMNAPVLRFEPSDTPGELKFVFHGGRTSTPRSMPTTTRNDLDQRQGHDRREFRVREATGSEHGANTPVASYKVTAAGSAIVQTSGAGTPNEMATIFHMDGDQLLQTHYCALMNAPVLRFEPSDTPGELKFVFHGGTNFDAAVDAHYHEGTIWIKDKDTIDASFSGAGRLTITQLDVHPHHRLHQR